MSRPRLLAASVAVLATVAAYSDSAHAQTAGLLPRATHLPSSTRAMALGDSYQADARQADALFVHPALLTGSSGAGIEVQRWGPATTAAQVSAAAPLFGGRVGFGVRSLQYSPPGTGSAAAPAGQDDFFQTGPVAASEQIATIGFARGVGGVDLGVSASIVGERVGVTRHAVTLFDIGIAREIGDVTLALTAQDLGETPIVDTGLEPSRIVFGASSYGQELGILDLGFAAHVGLDEGEAIYGGGIEVGYWPIQGRTVVVRLGAQEVAEGTDQSPITLGAAFWADGLTVEWAFRPLSGADEGGTHRFGVRLR